MADQGVNAKKTIEKNLKGLIMTASFFAKRLKEKRR